MNIVNKSVLGTRVSQEVKDALKAKGTVDNLSLAAYAEKVLTEHCFKNQEEEEGKQEQFNELVQKLQQLEDDNRDLQKQNLALEKAYDVLEDSRSDEKDNYDDLLNERDELRTKLDELREEFYDLERRHEEVQEMGKGFFEEEQDSEELEETKEELEDLRGEYEEVLELNKELSGSLDAIVTNTNEMIKATQKEILDLKSRLEEVQQKYDTVFNVQDLQCLRTQLAKLQKYYPDLNEVQLLEVATACTAQNEESFFFMYTVKDYLNRNPNFFTQTSK